MKEKNTVEVEKWSKNNPSPPVIKFTNVNCAKWGIKKPKIGQKIKIIYDW